MTKLTTKPDTMQPATEMAVDLFDNWFDPIETEVRARARQFIEGLIPGELHDARVRADRNRGPAGPADHAGGGDGGMDEPGAAGLSASHACRRRADRKQLSSRHQYQAGAPGARVLVRRDGRQGHGEPDLAQGEG